MAIKTLDDLVASTDEKVSFAITKTQLKEVLKTAFGEIQTLAKAAGGDVVRIHGFGTFEMKTRAARTGRNPATGEAIQIAESSTLHFKATKSSK